MPCASRERGGKNNPGANLRLIELRVLLNCCCQICVLVDLQFPLIFLDIIEALLLANGPRVYQIFKKELPNMKEVIGFICTRMKTIGQKLSHAHSSPFPIIIRDPRMPTHLSSREKQNIVKSQVKGMDVRDAFMRQPSSAVKNNITAIRMLIFIAWNDHCNVIGDCEKILVARIGSRQIAKSDRALLLGWHVPCQFPSRC